MSSIGERLKEERVRLGFSQEQFGAIGLVKKLAQISYESGKSYPNAQYLSQLAKIGLDVQYIVTGVKSNIAISNDEQALLASYRNAPLAVREYMLSGLNNIPNNSNLVAGTGNTVIGNGSSVKLTLKNPTKKK